MAERPGKRKKAMKLWGRCKGIRKKGPKMITLILKPEKNKRPDEKKQPKERLVAKQTNMLWRYGKVRVRQRREKKLFIESTVRKWIRIEDGWRRRLKKYWIINVTPRRRTY